MSDVLSRESIVLGGQATDRDGAITEAGRLLVASGAVDEAYVEYGARTCAPWVDELPNLVVVRTLSKAFGFASLRVGYALAHPETAALLTERRAPAPIAGAPSTNGPDN